MNFGRKGALFTVVGMAVVATVTAGILFWRNSDDPRAIDYPRSVCGGALTGSAVSPLFPTEGDPFRASASVFAKSGHADSCMMAAGGRRVELRLYTHRGTGESAREHAATDDTWDDEPGYTKIALGPAAGHAGNSFARLELDCASYVDGSFVLDIWINYYDVHDEDVPNGKRGDFAALAAEALRYSAGKQGLNCKEGAELPQGAPALG